MEISLDTPITKLTTDLIKINFAQTDVSFDDSAEKARCLIYYNAFSRNKENWMFNVTAKLENLTNAKEILCTINTDKGWVIRKYKMDEYVVSYNQPFLNMSGRPSTFGPGNVDEKFQINEILAYR